MEKEIVAMKAQILSMKKRQMTADLIVKQEIIDLQAVE